VEKIKKSHLLLFQIIQCFSDKIAGVVAGKTGAQSYRWRHEYFNAIVFRSPTPSARVKWKPTLHRFSDASEQRG